MGRKLLWTALTTVLTSVAAGLAFRVAKRIWEAVAHEPPPNRGLAGFLLQRPLRKRIFVVLHAPPP
jgi:hypothetical protein